MKRFISILIICIITVSFAACGDKTDETTTSVAADSSSSSVSETVDSASGTSDESSTTVTETESETTTEATTESTTESTTEPTTESTTESTTEPTTESTALTTTKSTTTTKKATTTKKSTTKKATTTKKPEPTAPSSVKDIVALYNSATQKASSAKPGYSKTTNTVLSNLNIGALARISVVRDAVAEFLGEGKTTSKVSKGKFDGKSLKVSTLTAADVTSATCSLSKDKKYYDIRIVVKNETNPIKGKSALSKFSDDYKDNNEIRTGLVEADAKVGNITMNTNSAVITARITVDSNKFVSLNHSIKLHAILNDVKYLIASVKEATADLSVTADYSDFVY